MSILEIILQYLNPLKLTLEKEIQNNYIYVCMFLCIYFINVKYI